MIGAARNRDPPGEAGAADAEVLEPTLDEAKHFVAAARRLDEARMGGIMVEQFLLVGRQAEEPAFLDRPFDRRALWRELFAALALDQLALVVIGFVADRVPAVVAVEREVATVGHRRPDRARRGVMIGVGGADETIVRHLKYIAHRPEL